MLLATSVFCGGTPASPLPPFATNISLALAQYRSLSLAAIRREDAPKRQEQAGFLPIKKYTLAAIHR
jgi:hypothetical protein